jgi:hypothetical protein
LTESAVVFQPKALGATLNLPWRFNLKKNAANVQPQITITQEK